MNINEALKEVAALKGKLSEVSTKIRRQQVIKEYVSQELGNVPTIKQPAPVDPLVNDHLEILAQIENLKLQITAANLKSGALTLIHKVSYLKAALALLKPMAETEEESLDMTSSYLKSPTMVKTKVNYDLKAINDMVVKTDLELRETLVALDKLNYSTEI